MTESQIKKEHQIGNILHIDVKKIFPNPSQPRKSFSEEGIIKLADSISRYGIIQPLSVRQIGENYELIAGERRLRAAKELNLTTVPCIISNVTEEKSAEISIIENLIREDLNIFEQAEAIEALIDTYNLTQEQIAEKLSNSQSFVANKLRLLRFNAQEREIILKNNLTERHARSLLRISDNELRRKLIDRITKNNLNVAATENLIESYIMQNSNANCDKNSQKLSKKSISALYLAINKAIDNIKSQGIDIKSRRVEGKEFTEFTILIPKNNAHTPTVPTEQATINN